jgi:uncharacterized protein (TIGR02246 family)
MAAICAQDAEVESQIAEVMRRHVAAHIEEDAIAAAADYTDDVWFMLDDGAELRSRETVVEFYEELHRTTQTVDLVYTDVETTVCGDAAHAVGHYSHTIEVDGQQSTSRAQYMVLWRRQPDGSWKLSRGAAITIAAEE